MLSIPIEINQHNFWAETQQLGFYCQQTEAPKKYLRPQCESFRQGESKCAGVQACLGIFHLFFQNQLAKQWQHVVIGTRPNECASARAFHMWPRVCPSPLAFWKIDFVCVRIGQPIQLYLLCVYVLWDTTPICCALLARWFIPCCVRPTHAAKAGTALLIACDSDLTQRVTIE